MTQIKSNIPKIRFKEFSWEWEEKIFWDEYNFILTNSYSRDMLNYEWWEIKNIHYWDIHTKFKTHFKIQNEKVPFINNNIDLSKLDNEKLCIEKDLVIADASEDYKDIWKTIELIDLNNEKLIAWLHTYIARPNNNIASWFWWYLMNTYNIHKQVMFYAVWSKVLGVSKWNLNRLNINLPQLPEQQKIASFLSLVDEKIENIKEKKKSLEEYKKGVMQKIFNVGNENIRSLRFKDESGGDFGEWEEKKLGEILEYEQPTKYIVDSTEYKNNYKIPVLTAWKTFILWYTNEINWIFKAKNNPVIIFDDFTTSKQFVNFDFKVKSSAMKILKNINNKVSNIKYIFELMWTIKFNLWDEHKRFWISEYSEVKVFLPSLPEQQKMADFLSGIDEKIESVGSELEKVEEFKKGLLQGMFV